MIINPFEIQKFSQSTKNTLKFDISALQQYIISNYIKYLQQEDKIKLIPVIKNYLIDKYNINNSIKQEEIINELLDKMFGYDILQKYIEMENVTDIRVVSFDSIYIKVKGQWINTHTQFESIEKFEEFVRYCVLKNSSNINYDVPIVIVSDKKYNLRIEAGISPANSISPSLVIRIHKPDENFNLESLLLLYEMLDNISYKYIVDAITNEKNIVISGRGGSGKTTLLRAMVNKIPNEKSVTINEETTELYIKGKNVIQREVIENRNETKKITLEKLMKHSLVMSNDVLVVGELKGVETTVFLDAISTGHMGLATVHSNSAQNTIERLVTLFKRDYKNQQYSEHFITQILANSINYIIYMSNYKVCEIIKIEYDTCLKQEKIAVLYKRGDR